MRKKRIVIIILCVLLLTVAALTLSRGLEMRPELAAVGNAGGAQTENESPEGEKPVPLEIIVESPEGEETELPEDEDPEGVELLDEVSEGEELETEEEEPQWGDEPADAEVLVDAEPSPSVTEEESGEDPGIL